ncbi:16S rRNA (cytosine(967)-C(5))-methyltransferase RsmB [Aliikangiella maris]|uniref:16S rRNA (cytosine(967)-C(5))-methyltransferase n=2 Tax=Aliikangiella maris TaxID=3162458 RepID=A0ABV3MNU1_9GAMM
MRTDLKITDARMLALYWLQQVIIEGKSVNQLMAESAMNDEHLPYRSLSKQLMFGCLRYYFQLKTITENLLSKPLKAKDHDITLIIIIGLYQLNYLSVPDHAAISESVELTKKINKNWASGLVNGILREYQRSKEKLADKLGRSIQFKTAHPGWMVKQFQQDWPEQADFIIEQNNQQALMIVRVNTCKISRDEYQKQLSQNDIECEQHKLAADALILKQAVDVHQLPGFLDGLVTVQDAAPQLAVDWLKVEAGQRVLDACAAPGGKTTHLLQRYQPAQLIALEVSPSRADKIKQTLARMQLSCEVQCADLIETSQWWDGVEFDRILLDVPCSATGVIRRNPDIKIHRKVTDIQPLVKLQREMLVKCWQMLKPGGVLLYATCSLLKAENEAQIQWFVDKESAILVEPPESFDRQLNHTAQMGYQIFPGELLMDGFYLCALSKPKN